jgi:RimJ/RimL family protein N-acetyltransferase
LDDFFAWASDPEVAKYMTWEAYSNKEDGLAFLKNVAETHPYFKAIVFEGKIVGSITLSINSSRAELGYVLARKYWGKGIATLAAKKAVEEGFSLLHLRRIEAFVDPSHIASQKVLEKSGMIWEGLLKNYMIFKGRVSDRYCYAITKN